MKHKTIREAAYSWIQTFNAVENDLIQRAFKNDIDYWHELTTASVGDYVAYNGFSVELAQPYNLYVATVDAEEGEAILTLDDETDIEAHGDTLRVSLDDVAVEYDGWLPMWGTLFSPAESCDEYWIRENLILVSALGFRIFEDDHTGTLYLGIDGAGYDFYEQHWIPLYQSRGLQWHEAA